MFSVFYEDDHRGIEIEATGQQWFVEMDYEVRQFVKWLNEHVAQQNAQQTDEMCPTGGNHEPINKVCRKCGLNY